MPQFVLLPAVVLWVVLAQPLAAAQRLNVVLIAVDDMNTDVGCYGHPLVKTPAIDSLARRGVRFEHAYCQYPVCNPSRVSLLSGLRPDTTGVLDLQTPPRTLVGNAVFLPQHFRNQGYYTAHIGKIFHTGDAMEDPASWDFEAREWGKQPPADKVLRHQRIERPRKYHVEWHELSSEDAETADGVVARQAAAMLDKLKTRGQPFFLAVGFRRPHAPYAAPKKYFDMYPPDKVPPLVEPAEHLTKIPVAALTYPPGTPLLSARQRAENVAAYWACITFVDAQIAHVLEALDRNNLAHNTVLVFYSDHGYHLGEHGGMWHKMSVFEESARVPLIVVAPGTGFASGRACPRIVELLDVYPTLVELCGLPAVNGLQGASLVPLLRNPDAEWQRPAFTQVIHDEVVGRSVRTPRWRYTEWDGGRQGVELYDHDADSHEYVNVANDPQWASVRNELHGLLPADKETPQPAKQ